MTGARPYLKCKMCGGITGKTKSRAEEHARETHNLMTVIVNFRVHNQYVRSEWYFQDEAGNLLHYGDVIERVPDNGVRDGEIPK